MLSGAFQAPDVAMPWGLGSGWQQKTMSTGTRGFVVRGSFEDFIVFHDVLCLINSGGNTYTS